MQTGPVSPGLASSPRGGGQSRSVGTTGQGFAPRSQGMQASQGAGRFGQGSHFGSTGRGGRNVGNSTGRDFGHNQRGGSWTGGYYGPYLIGAAYAGIPVIDYALDSGCYVDIEGDTVCEMEDGWYYADME